MVWANAAAAASKPMTKTAPTILSKTLPTLRFINSSSTNFLNEPTTLAVAIEPSPQARSNSISILRKSQKFYHEEPNFQSVKCAFNSRRPLDGTMCLRYVFWGGKLWQLFAYRSE